MAELCEDVLVLAIDEPSRPNLKGDIVTFEAVALDGVGELLVPCRCFDVGRCVLRHICVWHLSQLLQYLQITLYLICMV